MSAALRQRAAGLARQARPSAIRNTRSYASESHGSSTHGHHAPPAGEPLGSAFFIAMGTIPACMFVYSISRPNENGEDKSLTQWFERKIKDYREEFEGRNDRMTALLEQAAHDRHLLTYAPGTNGHHELVYPEVFQHGSPFNVPAGHGVNLDKVIAHYRKLHLDEEERKAKKLAEAK